MVELPKKLIFGCGYLGRRVADQWAGAGEEVWVVTRDQRRAELLARDGFHPLVADVTRSSSLKNLPSVDTVLYAVGYDRRAGASQHEVYVDGLTNVLDRLAGDKLKRFLYISSTGVYGQRDGSWVDEDSICHPTREGGRVCLAAEERLAAHSIGPRRIVLRLAGIYGPNRIPQLETILSGLLPPGSDETHLNLIHVDDAVRTILAAENHATPPARYVVSDGKPVSRGDFYRYVAQLAWPAQLGPNRQQSGSSRSANQERSSGSDKRLDNRRMIQELGVRVEYCSFREGLSAIAAERLTGLP